MNKGPRGEKRPADVIGGAVGVARIATGEEPEEITDDGKDKAVQALGKRRWEGEGGEDDAGAAVEGGC